MDDFNENLNKVEKSVHTSSSRSFSKTVKVLVIAALVLLLLIPMVMIESMLPSVGRRR